MSSLSRVSARCRSPRRAPPPPGRRRDAEHGPAVGSELGDGRREGGRLARARRPDHEHEVVVAGDRTGDLSLGGVQLDIAARPAAGWSAAVVGEPPVGPGDQRVLLVDDRLGRQGTIDDRLGDRAPVPAEQRARWHRPGQLDAPSSTVSSTTRSIHATSRRR